LLFTLDGRAIEAAYAAAAARLRVIDTYFDTLCCRVMPLRAYCRVVAYLRHAVADILFYAAIVAMPRLLIFACRQR